MTLDHHFLTSHGYLTCLALTDHFFANMDLPDLYRLLVYLQALLTQLHAGLVGSTCASRSGRSARSRYWLRGGCNIGCAVVTQEAEQDLLLAARGPHQHNRAPLLKHLTVGGGRLLWYPAGDEVITEAASRKARQRVLHLVRPYSRTLQCRHGQVRSSCILENAQDRHLALCGNALGYVGYACLRLEGW